MDLASAPAAVVSAYLEMLVFDICCGRNGRAQSTRMVAIFHPLVDQQLFCTPSCRFAAATLLVMRRGHFRRVLGAPGSGKATSGHGLRSEPGLACRGQRRSFLMTHANPFDLDSPDCVGGSSESAFPRVLICSPMSALSKLHSVISRVGGTGDHHVAVAKRARNALGSIRGRDIRTVGGIFHS
jgi:hypothetical protein